MFYAVATLIDQPTWQGILDQNSSIRDWFSTHGNEQDIITHFSWLVSQEMQVERVSGLLSDLAERTTQFTCTSGGLGIFPGTVPAITLNLARNIELSRFQEEIWNSCQPYIGNINQKYSPDRWIPHITMLHHGVGSMDYCDFLQKIISNEISFELNVNNLSLIYKDVSSAGQITSFQLLPEVH